MLHLVIHGRVQGVGYRAWTVATAKRHGLTGWVRNRIDGTVEAVLIGDALGVKTMQAACERGPLAAKVTQIDAVPWTSDPPNDFRSLPTI